ncbi:MAG: TVP38/TMEM64 family protein [Chloroflexota bacterium]|nr:TVP38/TMEM64 family protein [Chloroflexota bacterium]
MLDITMTEPTDRQRFQLTEQTVRRTQIAIILVVLAAGVIAYFTIPAFRAEIERLGGIAARNDVDALRDYILSFGVWAPVISVGLMVLQSIIAPIPAFLVVFANGMAFGTIPGWLLSLFSQMLAAAICFGIGRALGRNVVQALIGKFGLESADGWFARWGLIGLFVTRLVPGIGFDAISYAAGLTKMTFRAFMLVTLAGSGPQLLLYSFLGENATEYVWWLLGLTVVVAIVVGGVALLKAWRQKRAAESAGRTPGPPSDAASTIR